MIKWILALAIALTFATGQAHGQQPGDVDGSGTIDADDVFWLHVLLSIGQANATSDSDQDGDTDIVDLYHLVRVRLGKPYGDLDFDGDVDVADQIILISNWTGAVQSPIPDHLLRTYFEGDLGGSGLGGNVDSLVNTIDANIQLIHWTGAQ